MNGGRPPTEEQVLRIALAFVLTPQQKEIVNRHLDSASFYTIPSVDVCDERQAGGDSPTGSRDVGDDFGEEADDDDLGVNN